MNRTQSNGGFEERLLAKLKQDVADRASTSTLEQTSPARRPAWKPRLALAAGATALGVAGAFALLPALSGDSGAAYAVTQQSDGTVRVEIYEFKDPAGLQRRLEEAGIPAQVDYLPSGKTCDHRVVEPGPVLGETESDGTVAFTLDPADYQGGGSFVMEADEGGDTVEFYTAEGEVGPCVPVDNNRAPDGELGPDADHAGEHDVEDAHR